MDCMILVQALIAFVVLGHNAETLNSLVVAAGVSGRSCVYASCLDNGMRA